MKNLYDFKKLVKQVYIQLKEKLSEKELEDLLTVGEEAYQKDSPISMGKRIVINSLEFHGTKKSEDIETPIRYKRNLCNGINLWVGDNFVGKSSIFKIITLAITGNKKISRDVEKWLTEIWVEFSLNNKIYYTYIDRDKQNRFRFSLFNGARLDGALSNSEIIVDTSSESNVEQHEKDNLLFEGGIGKYEEFMQGFFFRELAYYSLQWTQHDSRPEVLELRTAAASWSTYFKSIYLEADDYGFLFIGGQAELIFQMLLGLELTYPINRLVVKRKHFLNQLSILKLAESTSNQISSEEDKLADEKRLIQLTAELINLNLAIEKAATASSQGIEETLELVRHKYRLTLSKRAELELEQDSLNSQIAILERQLNIVIRQIDDYEIDIKKKKRRINDLQELLDLGSFFSSLEVRTCPNCNHSVENQKVQQEKSTGNCRLCSNEVEHEPINTDTYNDQIVNLRDQYKSLFQDQYLKKIEENRIHDEIRQKRKIISNIEEEIVNLQIENLFTKLVSLQKEIEDLPKASFDVKAHVKKIADASIEKALLEQKLNSDKVLDSKSAIEQDSIDLKIQALDIAENILQQERIERSQSLIQTFEELYLKQLRSFGLSQYERVEVKHNFKIAYYKGGEEYAFSEITTGEQLRAKLGLYVALIELDIEHQLGRHPRFLVLDSPAKEEGDKTYVEGLKTTLSYIQSRFGKELQIFIGTAQRELAFAVDAHQVEIRGEKEYFF